MPAYLPVAAHQPAVGDVHGELRGRELWAQFRLELGRPKRRLFTPDVPAPVADPSVGDGDPVAAVERGRSAEMAIPAVPLP